MIDFSLIKHIAFDADDTLWQNEDFYHATEIAFANTLKAFVSPENAQKALFQSESKNMELLGYGSKAMTISMVETAVSLVPNISSELVQQVVDIGKQLLQMPTILLPGALETVRHFMKTHHVFILTKGDLLEQERKFENSPFKSLGLEYIVLSGKDPDDYRTLLKRLNIQTSEFMMIGNSPRSDVLAPLEIGAYAVHVPYSMTWAHEHVELQQHPKMLAIDNIQQLVKLSEIHT